MQSSQNTQKPGSKEGAFIGVFLVVSVGLLFTLCLWLITITMFTPIPANAETHDVLYLRWFLIGIGGVIHLMIAAAIIWRLLHWSEANSV